MHATPSIEELAALVLPTIGDLAGRGWVQEDELAADAAAAGGALAALADACLPEAFPDRARRADAEATFRQGGDALVLALAAVFADRGSAAAAWQGLAGEEFVRCFAESIAGEVRDGSSVELLGPLVTPGELTVERGARRTERWRVAFSGVHDGGLAPVVLHVAVLLVGCVVELVWAVDGGRPGDLEAWEHLVARAEQRADVVVRTHADQLDP